MNHHSEGAQWRSQDSRAARRLRSERKQQRRKKRRAYYHSLRLRFDSLRLFVSQLSPEGWPLLESLYPELINVTRRLRERPLHDPELRLLLEAELAIWFPILGVVANGDDWLVLEADLLIGPLQIAAHRLYGA